MCIDMGGDFRVHTPHSPRFPMRRPAPQTCAGNRNGSCPKLHGRNPPQIVRSITRAGDPCARRKDRARRGTGGITVRSVSPVVDLGGQCGPGGRHSFHCGYLAQPQAAAKTAYFGRRRSMPWIMARQPMPSVWLKPWPTKISPAMIGEGPISSSGRLPPKLLKRPRASSGSNRSTWPHYILPDRGNEGFPQDDRRPACTCSARPFFAAAARMRPYPRLKKPCRKMPPGRTRSARC